MYSSYELINKTACTKHIMSDLQNITIYQEYIQEINTQIPQPPASRSISRHINNITNIGETLRNRVV